jgi:hypothetical protein
LALYQKLVVMAELNQIAIQQMQVLEWNNDRKLLK